MKFVCLECDRAMEFAERQLPGDGTLAAVYTCPGCRREMALLTNPMETRLVSSMGVKIGGREVPEQPMELVRRNLEGGDDDVFVESPPTREPVGESAHAAAPRPGAASPASDSPASAGPPPESTGAPPPSGDRPVWTGAATERLEKVPRFVRGMVKRIYTDWARERAIAEITPEIMDRARSDLGLEGM